MITAGPGMMAPGYQGYSAYGAGVPTYQGYGM